MFLNSQDRPSLRDHLFPMKRSLYDLLGVSPSATPDEIHKAYRRLARKVHPDSHPTVSDELRTRLGEEMSTLNHAWEVLGDPDRRLQYNRELGIDEKVDLFTAWVQPPLPSGFDHWPRAGLFPTLFSKGPGAGGYGQIGDSIHQALSLVPLQNDLSSLRKLWPDGVWRLHASGVRITDDQLVHVAGLTGLEDLDLSDTAITDNGLELLTGLTKLNDLGLRATAITDAGLRHIGRITSIEALTLSNTAITDEGLAHLSALEKLDYLDLRGTEVKGPGLSYLRTITDLDVVSLSFGIPRKFRRELRKALPHLEIRH